MSSLKIKLLAAVLPKFIFVNNFFKNYYNTMPYEKNKNYKTMPFCVESNRKEFYTYYDIENLVTKAEMFKEHCFKCRTLGVLKSINGNFFISSIKLPKDKNISQIRLSLLYLKTYPKSTVIPYTVQIFGTLHWKGEAIIYVKLLQTITTSMAFRLQETLSSVTGKHLAHAPREGDDWTERDTVKS